jgi:hypothetical protein
MKDNIDDKLNDLLDIDTEIKTVSSNVVKVTPRSESIESDYKYARENLYNLVERGQDAIEGILELSKETEHPRAYEEKLLDVQKKIKDLEKDDERKIGTQHNHLYVGSTSELQKFLKKEKQKE